MLYPDFKRQVQEAGLWVFRFPSSPGDSDTARNSRASHAALSAQTAWGFVNLWTLIQEVWGRGLRACFSNQLPSSRATPGVAKGYNFVLNLNSCFHPSKLWKKYSAWFSSLINQIHGCSQAWVEFKTSQVCLVSR